MRQQFSYIKETPQVIEILTKHTGILCPFSVPAAVVVVDQTRSTSGIPQVSYNIPQFANHFRLTLVGLTYLLLRWWVLPILSSLRRWTVVALLLALGVRHSASSRKIASTW